MVVRAEELTTQSIWDDTDIVHVVLGEIAVNNHHTYSGLRLQSSATESLVVKLEGDDAGFTANGIPLEIDDRIGGDRPDLGHGRASGGPDGLGRTTARSVPGYAGDCRRYETNQRRRAAAAVAEACRRPGRGNGTLIDNHCPTVLATRPGLVAVRRVPAATINSARQGTARHGIVRRRLDLRVRVRGRAIGAVIWRRPRSAAGRTWFGTSWTARARCRGATRA